MESSSRTSFSSSEQSFSSGRSAKKSSRPRSSEIHHSLGSSNIKESIYKDTKSVSINEKAKGEVKRNKVLKQIDSPRPMDLSKFNDLEESLRILIKLKELPRNFHEVGCSPRFSYDGRGILQTSTDIRHVIKQKEHRRLSLDGMEDSLRREFNSKFSSLIKELEMKTNHRVSEASNLLQDLESNEKHPSIVAKLMGLESINSAIKNRVKGYESVNTQKKQESKDGKLLQSPSNSTKSQISINQQKIESVYSLMEKALQKLQLQHNSKEIRDLRRAMLEIKKKSDLSFRTIKSMSPQITQLASKSENASISERALKSSSQCAKLEGPSGLRRIRTSSKKKNGSSSADGQQTPTGKTANSFLNSSSKETSRRAGDNSVSPRLQKRKPDQEKKSCASIPSHDLKKTRRQPGNRQQSESMSLSGSRIRQKPIKAQDNEGKSHLLQQTKGKTPPNAATASKHKQHQMIPRNVLSAEEIVKVAPQLSSPNSVLDASLYQDDLPLSPLSVSSLSNAEDENLLSDNNLKMTHLSHTLHSTLSLETDSQKQEILPPLDNNDFYFKYVDEVLLASGLLSKDPNISSLLEQIKPVEPSEAVEKNNSQMLQKQLVYDVVNEILARKREAFNSGCQHGHLLEPNRFSAQFFFKELCSELKCLQTSRDGSMQDKDSAFTKDLVWRSKAWNSFESEVPDIVLEIERLTLADLINEVLSNVTAVVLETKLRHRRHMFV